jgi:type IV pilus assembly protein PilM
MAKRIVGINIGFSTLRAAQVRLVKGQRPVVEKIYETQIPKGMVEFGDIKDRVGFTELLKKFWADAGFESKRVVMAAGSLHVFARELTVPKMSMQRIKESLPFLMQGVLPVPPEELYIDFYPSQELADETGPTIRGLAVAAERSHVDTLVDCMTAAKLHSVAVDFIPFALTRARFNLGNSGGTVALVDVGAGATNVIIASDIVPLFVRIITSGGQDIDRALVLELNLTAEQAAEKKLSLTNQPTDPKDLVVWNVIQKAMQDFVSGVKNTIDYFEQAHPGVAGTVAQVLLTGGGSRLAGIGPALQEVIHIPVTLDGGLMGIDLAPGLAIPDEKMSQMAIAIGLAMGAAE